MEHRKVDAEETKEHQQAGDAAVRNRVADPDDSERTAEGSDGQIALSE